MISGQDVRAKVVHRAHQNGHEVNDVLMADVEEGTSAQQQTFGSDQNRRLAFIQTTARIKDELRKAEQGQTSGQTIERLFEQVHRSNVDIDNVDNFRTLCRGSEALDQLIQLSVSQVEGMKDETAHSFDPGKLVARLKSFAIAHRKTEDKDHFTTIGRHFNFLLRKTPNFSYLRPCYEMKADGPHLREKTQRKRATQTVKEETQIVQGKTLSEMGESAAAASTADDGTGGSSTAVNKELDNVRRHLKRVYKQNGTDAVDYYRFVLHPDSFGETVENMFFVSFLIRDGQVRLRVDPSTGLASIVKLSHEEREERRCAERSKTQTVPRLDYDTWRRMVCELKIDKPYITRRVHANFIYLKSRTGKVVMPKKFQAENTKAVASRARKTEAKATERARDEQAKEDAHWRDDDKHVQKKAQRKNDLEQKRQQELDRKQANKQAYEQELNTLAEAKQKQQQQPATKVTQAQIERERQLEETRRKEAEQVRLLELKNIMVQDEAELLGGNVNRLSIDGQVAQTVEEAISVLKQPTDQHQQQDLHPEKRVRAAFTAFEERRLAELKEERPTLRLSQLKQLVKKEWLKSVENPLNQHILGIVQQQ
ncbi:hypothetical protein GPALN_011352 [Globodera pallida]|nr:hypothetical protein GPALN_011352 [Globodera pallida]